MKVDDLINEIELACQLNNEQKNSTKEEKEFKKFLETHRKKYEHIIMVTPNMESLR